MEIVNFTPFPSLIGGLMIGLASVLLMLFNGKIAGISGITKGIISPQCDEHERKWRIAFVTGLILGGFITIQLIPNLTAKFLNANIIQMIIAGLLVGFGTALGNGCTSGHGVCGLGRRSTRSLYSVITFISVAMITVYIMFHILKIGI
ncbi:MAG: YeeE/YedE family protein [Candidatus Sericytochromatia bacterium]